MLALLLLLWDAPAPDLRPVQTLDLGKLDWHQARALSGKRVRVTFVVDRVFYEGEGEELNALPGLPSAGQARRPRAVSIGAT
jgi:hypothetical protein